MRERDTAVLKREKEKENDEDNKIHIKIKQDPVIVSLFG